MNIDKAAFLLLATAIAATACVIKNDPDGSGGSGGNGNGGSGNTGNIGGSAGDGGSAGSAGSAGEGGAPACLGDEGVPGDCSMVQMNDCSVNDLDLYLCDQSIIYFRAGVAEEAVACMLGLEATGTCADVYSCRNDALRSACEIGDEAELCTDFVSCGADPADCADIISGFNADGVAALFAQCGTASGEGCFQGFATLEECINNMISPI